MKRLEIIDSADVVRFFSTSSALLPPLTQNLLQLLHLQFLQVNIVQVNLFLCTGRTKEHTFIEDNHHLLTDLPFHIVYYTHIIQISIKGPICGFEQTHTLTVYIIQYIAHHTHAPMQHSMQTTCRIRILHTLTVLLYSCRGSV